MKPIYLMISEMFPSNECFRGPFIYDLAKSIHRQGAYRVIIAKPVNIGTKLEPYEYDGISVLQFYKTIPSSGVFSNFFWLPMAGSLISTLHSCGISINEIDVCHLHGTSFSDVSRMIQKFNNNIKTIVHHHNLDIFGIDSSRLAKRFPSFKSVIRNNIFRMNEFFDLHLMVSGLTQRQFLNFPEFILKKCYTLYNGVDLQKFHPLPDLKSKDTFHIGCVGNFIPLKDQMTLLRASERLIEQGMKDLHLKFIGSGPTKSACQKYASDSDHLNSRVEFLNEVDHRQLIDFYNSLNLFILPSYYEAFGCVYTEAYACGTPFMACCGQGIEELLPESEREKWLIPPHDFIALARKITEFRKNKPTQILNQPIDIDWHVGKYLDFLEDLKRSK